MRLNRIPSFSLQRSLSNLLRGVILAWGVGSGVYVLATYAQSPANSCLGSDLSPSSTLLLATGQQKGQKKDWQGALECFTFSINLDKDPDALLTAYTNRAKAYQELNNFPSALEDWNQVLQLNPKQADAYLNRGVIYYKQAEYPEALEDFDQAIQFNSQLAIAYYNRSLVHLIMKDDEAALEDANQALKLNQNLGVAYQIRGIGRYRLGDLQGSIQDLEAAIQNDGTLAAAIQNLGYIQAKAGNKEIGEKKLQQAKQLYLDKNQTDLYRLILEQIEQFRF